MRHYYLIYLSFFGILLQSWGQERSKIEFDLQGKAKVEYSSYFKELPEKINERKEGTLFLTGTLRFDEEATFKTVVINRKDFADDYRDRLFYVREAYFHFVDRKMDVQFGKQIVNWGTADIYNPTNNINPLDYTDFFDLEDNQLGVWMARAKRFHSDNKFTEILISPHFPDLAFPNPLSRWVVGLPTAMPDPLDPARMSSIQYNYENLQPTYKDVGWMLGIRNGLSASNWDFSKSLLITANYLPSFQNEIKGIDTTGIQIALQPLHQRLYVLGFDVATTFKQLGIRGELALKGLSKAQNKWSFETLYYEYTLGIDRTFSQLVFDKNVMVILQWVHQIILRNEQPVADNDIRFFLRRALLLRTELAFNYYSNFTLQALYTLDTQNLYFQPSLKYRVLDGLSLVAQADLFLGKPEGFLGQYLENDRWRVSVVYEF